MASLNTSIANGLYGFFGLPIGAGSGSPVNYLVQVYTSSSVLNPYTLTNTTLAASMSTTTGTPTNSTRPVSLYDGSANVTNADFGYRWGGSIGDFVWYEGNANGIQENTDGTVPGCAAAPCGAPGSTLVLWFDINNNGFDANDSAVGTYVTTSTGAYLFNNLPPGNYVVQSS